MDKTGKPFCSHTLPSDFVGLRYVQRVDCLDKKDLEDVQQVYQACWNRPERMNMKSQH